MLRNPHKDYKIFERLCGVNACKHVTLATTMWSDVSEFIGTEREKELTSIFWNEMQMRGMQIQRFLATYESAWDIVQSLVERMSITHIQIQRELIDISKSLPETNTSRSLDESNEAHRRRKRRSRVLQQEQAPESKWRIFRRLDFPLRRRLITRRRPNSFAGTFL
jgi:hypothetical protein